MRAVILCGGRGGRMGDLTADRPKPMVEIGGRPILWHIMRGHARHGVREFVLALGYLGEVIAQYFNGLGLSSLDWSTVVWNPGMCLSLVRLTSSTPTSGEPTPLMNGWMVHLVKTGFQTQNGGRIKRLASHLGAGTFLLSYGDGVSDIDLAALLAFHRAHGRLCTVAAVHPPERFGRLELDGDRVAAFSEKPQGEGWINAGFFACEPGVLNYIAGDETQWEFEPMRHLAADGQLMAFRHLGFWQCMDTAHERRLLEQLWATGHAPWKTWEG